VKDPVGLWAMPCGIANRFPTGQCRRACKARRKIAPFFWITMPYCTALIGIFYVPNPQSLVDSAQSIVYATVKNNRILQ